MRNSIYLLLLLLYLLHNDLWYWNDSRMIAGLPAGLAYHVAFCVVATALMVLLVKYAWPAHLDPEEENRS